MQKHNLNILVVDDDEDVAQAATILLKTYGFNAAFETNPERLLPTLEKNAVGVVLLDMNFRGSVFSGNEGLYWLQQVKKKYPHIVVIMITGYGDVELAVKAIKAGASDFILKPWQNEKLLASIQTAIRLHEARTVKSALPKTDEVHLVGQHPKLQETLATLKKVAPTDANVLITGENGTGKELVARMLHQQSQRANKPFVSVDMGSLNENLFESELFGHVKGAFTDAREDRTGRFEAANGGTLFLDEIGNLSSTTQAKLLSVLQNRVIYKVGSNVPIAIDIRLVSATNMPLQQMVKENKFRQDLLYRINTVEISLPPLRERREDIALLAIFFVELYCSKYDKPVKGLHGLALKQLEKYHWPGNVRELQHAIERAVILNDNGELLPGDFLLPLYEYTDEGVANTFNLEENETQLIKKAMQMHGGNISKAAAELGITRAALYRRMEKYGI
jgi:two-component system, NtrC family, response regulator HydG